MRVPCPECQTVFNLPDNAATPGRKLRCAVCHTVFPLQMGGDEALTVSEYGGSGAPDSKRKKRKSIFNSGSSKGNFKKILKFFLAFLGAIVLVLGILFALLTFTSVLDSYKEMLSEILPDSIVAIIAPNEIKEDVIITDIPSQTPSNEPIDRIGLLELRDMRQYIVTNEKVGKIAVVEGNVYNGFDKARGSINLEASLYDANKKLLFSKSQLAGTSVSLFQLQVLDQAELQASLTDAQSVLLNNSNVAPGSSVPFMILFYAPPESANEFGVRVTSADIINAPSGFTPEVQQTPTMDDLLSAPVQTDSEIVNTAPLTPHTGDKTPENMPSMEDLLKGN